MLTNNMANANTPGFKAEQSSIRSFPEMYMSNLGTTHIPTKNGLNLIGRSPVGAVRQPAPGRPGRGATGGGASHPVPPDPWRAP